MRRGGRVTSEYVASGMDALLIAALEADRPGRADDATWSRIRSERKELDDLERALDELAEQARDLARDALSAAGYHQHHRGEWRKRRVSRHREGEAQRADNGQLGGRPTGRLGGGQGTATRRRKRSSGTSFATSPTSWPGRTPSPVERVLAETAATSWFAFRLHEAQYACRCDIGRRNDARPIRARSASDRSSPPAIPEHPEDPRRRAPARPSGRSNQRRSPASQSTQRRGIAMKRWTADR